MENSLNVIKTCITAQSSCIIIFPDDFEKKLITSLKVSDYMYYYKPFFIHIFYKLYSKRDLNPHSRNDQGILSPSCLPIPSSEHIQRIISITLTF